MSSFDVSVGVRDFKSSVRPVQNATWATATSPSQFWEFTVNLTGFQAPTDVVVYLPPHAPGVVPPNGPSRRVWHEFVPLTAASARSVFTCDTGLWPVLSVRRGRAVRCKIVMVDAFGDRLKGVVEQFVVEARDGHVTPILPSTDGWTGVFKYTPPADGDGDVVTVTLTPEEEQVVNGTTVYDVADTPTTSSVLSCQSASWPPTTVLVGDRLNCSIAVHDGGTGTRRRVKGVPADFAVTVSFGDVNEAVPVRALVVGSGGYSMNFSVTVPALRADGILPVHAMNVSVFATSVGAPIESGIQLFDVAHQPAVQASALLCDKVERADRFSVDPVPPQGIAAFDVVVATFETVKCTITGHGAFNAATFPAKTLRAHYDVSARFGHVSELLPVSGGTALVFWYAPLRGCVASCIASPPHHVFVIGQVHCSCDRAPRRGFCGE